MAREENGKPEQGGRDKMSPTAGRIDSFDRGEIAQQQPSIREQAFVDRITKSDRWMIWLTAAIVFTGVVSAFISKGQWSVMEAQLDEMRDEQRPWIGAPTSVVGEIGSDGTYVLSIEMENPFLAGCVAYTFGGSDAVHHTAFGAHLKIDGGRVVGDRIYAADAN